MRSSASTPWKNFVKRSRVPSSKQGQKYPLTNGNEVINSNDMPGGYAIASLLNTPISGRPYLRPNLFFCRLLPLRAPPCRCRLLGQGPRHDEPQLGRQLGHSHRRRGSGLKHGPINLDMRSRQQVCAVWCACEYYKEAKISNLYLMR